MTPHAFGKEALLKVAREHWKQFLPRKYARLQKAGTLEQELRAAVKMTLDEMEDYRSGGANQEEAWDMARQDFLILPEESRTKA